MRKVNWHVIPYLMICYIIAYVDRVNAGFAALQMNGDIGLTAAMFGLGGTLFYIAYTAFEIPSNVAMAKVGPRIWMARIMITWGMVGVLAAFVRNPTEYYVTRFLLGAAEAGFFPGALYYVSQWYPMTHRARVVATFSVAVPLSLFIGSPISGALMELNGLLGLRGWQWIFILESIPAVLMGVFSIVFLVNRPADAKWLTADERAWLVRTLDAEQAHKKHVGHMSLKQIVTNKYVVLFGIIFAGASATSNSLALWMPQIIKSFHLTNLETALTASIPYGLACVAMVYWGRRTDRTGERVWATAIPLAITSICLASTNLTGSLTVTVALLSVALAANYSIKGPFWSLVGTYLNTQTAAAGFATVNTIAHIGTSITTSLIGVIRDRTGSFPLALLSLVCLTTVGALLVAWLGDGERRAAGTDAPAPAPETAPASALRGKT
ncbi:MFS transporter [Methylobacterium sp. NEAU 140]|uniref:MFS transporter n=1 Tax=Methylobacterium sp. NEAU 140 TaxID=3064945 RepID=UPI0027330808|nr:MFS transporter [Methylobacterium sp. NEAU 140]MDP4024284.1 MFS transporter [Methylobacterium sp. NEAU 140]